MLHKTNIHSKLTICALLMLFSMNTLFAKTLHMIIVAQANDPSIYSAKDYVKMQRLAEDISVATGMTLEKHYFDKSSLSEDRLRTEMNNLKCGADDVVWFYYCGFGIDYDGKWPMFSLGEIGVSLNNIHEKLKSKGARLTITMYDCCNHGIGVDNALGATRSNAPVCSAQMGETRQKGGNDLEAVSPNALPTVYTTLFLKSKGDIMMCSSKQGQFSIGISTGGVFTTSFITCLNRMQDVQNMSWSRLCEEIKAETQRTAQSLTQGQISGNCNPDNNGKCQQCPDAVVNCIESNRREENSYPVEEVLPSKVIKW